MHTYHLWIFKCRSCFLGGPTWSVKRQRGFMLRQNWGRIAQGRPCAGLTLGSILRAAHWTERCSWSAARTTVRYSRWRLRCLAHGPNGDALVHGRGYHPAALTCAISSGGTGSQPAALKAIPIKRMDAGSCLRAAYTLRATRVRALADLLMAGLELMPSANQVAAVWQPDIELIVGKRNGTASRIFSWAGRWTCPVLFCGQEVSLARG